MLPQNQLLYMGLWHLTELSAVMFPPFSIALLYLRGKMNGPIHSATNCEQ
jgi:hypothetical protein